MSGNDLATGAAVVEGLACLGSLLVSLAIWWHTRPLGELRKSVATLQAKIEEMVHTAIEKEIGALRSTQRDHAGLIDQIRTSCERCVTENNRHFISKADFERDRVEAKEQREVMTEEITKVRVDNGKQTKSIENIEGWLKRLNDRLDLELRKR
jgi:hypothetical protein